MFESEISKPNQDPQRTLGLWAIGIGIAGWPAASLIWSIAYNLETAHAYILRDTAIVIGYAFFVCSPFALMFAVPSSHLLQGP